MPDRRLKQFPCPLVAVRFWGKVHISRGCRIWTGSRDKATGQGRFYWNGAWSQAHRVAWKLVNGPIPAGMYVLHRCDNPACVNPDHLFLGPNRKVTQDQVREIRNSPLLAHQLAEKFCISETTVRSIRTHKIWVDTI